MILVVDDAGFRRGSDPSSAPKRGERIASNLRQLLKEQGKGEVQVEFASSVQEAHKLWASHKPILLFIHCSNDGWQELVRRADTNCDGKIDIPTVAYSGGGMTSAAAESQGALVEGDIHYVLHSCYGPAALPLPLLVSSIKSRTLDANTIESIFASLWPSAVVTSHLAALQLLCIAYLAGSSDGAVGDLLGSEVPGDLAGDVPDLRAVREALAGVSAKQWFEPALHLARKRTTDSTIDGVEHGFSMEALMTLHATNYEDLIGLVRDHGRLLSKPPGERHASPAIRNLLERMGRCDNNPSRLYTGAIGDLCALLHSLPSPTAQILRNGMNAWRVIFMLHIGTLQPFQRRIWLNHTKVGNELGPVFYEQRINLTQAYLKGDPSEARGDTAKRLGEWPAIRRDILENIQDIANMDYLVEPALALLGDPALAPPWLAELGKRYYRAWFAFDRWAERVHIAVNSFEQFLQLARCGRATIPELRARLHELMETYSGTAFFNVGGRS